MSFDEKGQSSVHDAMMFLSIMLVASALIVGVSNHLLRAGDVHDFERLHNHTTRLASTVLSSTVPNASYVDEDGRTIISKDISVLDMIIEELVMLDWGLSRDDFDGPGRYNGRIVQVVSALLDEDIFFYALCGQYGDLEIALGNSIPSGNQGVEVAASTARIPMPGEEYDVLITLHLWWK